MQSQIQPGSAAVLMLRPVIIIFRPLLTVAGLAFLSRSAAFVPGQRSGVFRLGTDLLLFNKCDGAILKEDTASLREGNRTVGPGRLSKRIPFWDATANDVGLPSRDNAYPTGAAKNARSSGSSENRSGKSSAHHACTQQFRKVQRFNSRRRETCGNRIRRRLRGSPRCEWRSASPLAATPLNAQAALPIFW
jgi:hypothetical protein